MPSDAQAVRLSEAQRLIGAALDEAKKRPDIPCDRCSGKGYHHGFGEHGIDPDWCETCGGAGSWRPGAEDVLAEWLLALRTAVRELQVSNGTYLPDGRIDYDAAHANLRALVPAEGSEQ